MLVNARKCTVWVMCAVARILGRIIALKRVPCRPPKGGEGAWVTTGGRGLGECG